MNPDIWGSSFWIILHLLSFEYSLDTKEYHKKFLNIVGDILPCSKCQIEYKKYMTKDKINEILHSKKKYIRGIWEFHNIVNERIHKKKISFQEFLDIYKEINKRKKLNSLELIKENGFLKKIICFMFILFIIFIIYLFIKIKII